MSTPLSAAAPVFSYAQAAKGLTPSTSTQATPRNESPAASEKAVKDRQVADATSALKSPPAKPDSDDKTNTESSAADTPAKTTGDKETISSTQQTSSADPGAGSSEQVDAPSNTATQDSRKDEGRPQLSNGRAYSSEQASEISGQGLGEKKPRESEDDWEKVSVPSMTAEKEFKAAPIPAVNVWQQRAAKLKELTVQQKPSAPSASSASKARPTNEDEKRRSLNKDVDSRERDGKPVEITRSNSRKDSTAAKPVRSSTQQSERTSGEAPPAVGDAQAWPTPESALVEERRKSSSLDKSDKTEPKSSQKKWTTMAFVPTAKFQTQLPPSVARRGGRGGGRGRDSTGRGGHNSSAGEKQDFEGSMGPPALPRQSGDQDRGRKAEGHRGARGASVPTSTARPESGEDAASVFRKPSAPAGTEQTGKDNVDNIISAVEGSGEHDITRTEHSSRSSSRPAGQSAAYPVNGDLSATTDQPSGVFVPSPDHSTRYPYSVDRFKGSGNGISRGSGEFGRERGSGRNREWSRDKPESAREKVESWRDREPSGDGSSRRESRPERGRGGYRGRGNHTYNPTYGSSHAYTSPLPQNGFESSRSSSHTESRSRQASQPFQPTQTPTSSRNNPRSQSIPVGMMFPGYYNGVPAMPQGLPAIQTDMQAYGYPTQMQMQPGIMSAMPFNDPLNSYALLSMVMTQVEYYFSIDNLCKDLFLRKHMDGQGYVPLSVIANFKRIKTLTDDNMALDTLRYVCQQVKSVEFLPGIDGEDRLRRREGWRDFVLPTEERFESAQNDGPSHGLDQYQSIPQHEQGPPVDPSFSMGQLRSPPLNTAPMNGIFHPNPQMSPYIPGAQADGNMGGTPFPTQFEEIAPEDGSRIPLPPFAQIPTPIRSPPSQGPLAMGGFVNGHNRQVSRADIEDNVFPDENIPNINIRMQPHAVAAPEDTTPMNGVGSKAFEQTLDSNEDGSNVEQSRVPNLRGGAGSPQQLDQFRNWSFGFSGTIPVADQSSIIYFTKDGQETQLPPPQLGQYDQSYQSLHDVAFQQHQLGVEDALEPLYSFWGDFLVDKFNLGMYQEFQATAVENLQRGSDSGMKHLVRYFGKVLGGRIPISERLASDMVNLSREEKANDRPLFHTLRAAWRNGATNMKTIKRLGDVLTPEEKAELDKSG